MTKSGIVVKRVCGGGDDACGGASGGGGGHHHHLFHSFEFGSCAVQGGMSGDLQLQCSFQTSKFSDRKLFPCRKSWELFNDWLQTQNSQNLRAPTEKKRTEYIVYKVQIIFGYLTKIVAI